MTLRLAPLAVLFTISLAFAQPSPAATTARQTLGQPANLVVAPRVGSLVKVTGAIPYQVGYMLKLQRREVGQTEWTTIQAETTGQRAYTYPYKDPNWYTFIYADRPGTYEFRIADPTVTPTAYSNIVKLTVEGATPTWLRRLNLRRVQFGSKPVVADPWLMSGARNHARYMARWGITHDESPGNQYYSIDGGTAGFLSDVGPSAGTPASSVDNYIRSAYHSLCALSPATWVSAFAQYRGVSVLTCHAAYDSSAGAATVHTPMAWPSNGMEMPYTRTYTGEIPDPWSACHIRESPTGHQILPVVFTLGNNQPWALSKATAVIKVNGHAHAACLLDEKNAGGTQDGDIGAPMHSLVVIPRASYPLHSRFVVVVTLGKKSVTTTFHT